MLTSYKKISVIYGGNGRKYASQIKDKLQDLHEKEFYPIKIEDLNTDWVGHDVLGTVVKTIRNSDLIYIVFTLDDIGASKRGIKAGMIRPITLWPFPDKPLLAAADKVRGFVCVELNMGQMKQDVELAVRCKKPVSLCRRVGGMIPTPDEVLASIQTMAEGGANA